MWRSSIPNFRLQYSSMVAPAQGLSFPFSAAPASGQTVEISPGVFWLSTYLPFRPFASHVCLLRDGDDWTMVDCGLPLPVVREQIEAAWFRLLLGQPLKRLIVTHHHPDHIGNCRWICERWNIAPTLTTGERQQAKILAERWPERAEQRFAFYLHHGVPVPAAREFTNLWSRNRELFSKLPEHCERVGDGDLLQIGGSAWRAFVVGGHAPEQLLLHSPERNLLISGDQILPMTTPNVSLLEDCPAASPLESYLQSNRRIAECCGRDVLVLPSHNLPFYGLHFRVQVLERLRGERLNKLEQELRRAPQSAAELIPSLFGDLYNNEIGFALGEVVAQLHYLAQQGRVRIVSDNGKTLFAAADAAERTFS